ncbi:polysaccharide biosynthesis protein [Pseudozobellia thermophila]|uniref:Membrane protein involved in the export of O-antigen and teichoic acid n=1 Tax=Pseudozobellia thermophila TaxID=192903 RepID=A0A1M6FSH8_9FLAO|nr:hypothetical protein [Pseudozobellia thermophila]SHJ00661.1 hypothetical protein SAMN04488513_102537 [Pseudozobellia thermophila]
MSLAPIKIKETTPESLIIGSVLLASGASYLYNLLLGQVLGPESFAEGAQPITLLIAVAFAGMVLQVFAIRFGSFFEKNRPFSNFKVPYTCGVALGLILLTSGLFYLTELKDFFPSTSWGSLMVLSASLPVCLVKRLMPGSFLSPFKGSVDNNSKEQAKKILYLVLLATGYEFVQIIIKNSDIVLVSHFFNQADTALYTSMALIGRAIYAVAWVFLLLFSLTVVIKHKKGIPTIPLVKKFIGYLGSLLALIVYACYLFPESIIELFFDETYLSASQLLWQLGLAVSLFVLSNIFTYYFLVTGEYLPAFFSTVVGVIQMLLILVFNDSISLVVQLQIISMMALLSAQILFFYSKTTSFVKPGLHLNQN